jgi:hypothetical protein
VLNPNFQTRGTASQSTDTALHHSKIMATGSDHAGSASHSPSPNLFEMKYIAVVTKRHVPIFADAVILVINPEMSLTLGMGKTTP